MEIQRSYIIEEKTIAKRIVFQRSKIVGKCSREMLDKRVVMAATLQAELYLKKLNRDIELDKDEVKCLAILAKIAQENPTISDAIQKQKQIEYLKSANDKNQSNDIIKQNIFTKLLGK